MPLDRQYRIGVGVQYAARHNLTLGAAYQYMDAGEAPVNQSSGPLTGGLEEGKMDRTDFQFFALNANWTF